jgi:hypothetical protein
MQKILESLRNKLAQLNINGSQHTLSQATSKKRLPSLNSNSPEKPVLDINEMRKRGIQEIFNFYSRQHIPQGRKFEEMQESMSEVDLGEFMRFCKDFEIPLHKSKI